MKYPTLTPEQITVLGPADSAALSTSEVIRKFHEAFDRNDPAAMEEAQRRLGDTIEYAENNYDALTGADALVIVTDWNEYRHPDFGRMKEALRRPIIIDGRNLYAPEKLTALGFTYRSFGRALA